MAVDVDPRLRRRPTSPTCSSAAAAVAAVAMMSPRSRPPTGTSFDSTPSASDSAAASPHSVNDGWTQLGQRIDEAEPRRTRRPSSIYRTSSGSSQLNSPVIHSSYSLYPAPTKPLPPLPPPTATSRRYSQSAESQRSRMSYSTTRSSHSGDSSSFQPVSEAMPEPHDASVRRPQPTTRHRSDTNRSTGRRKSMLTELDLSLWKVLASEDKRINNSVHYLDISPSSSVLASKHGNNIVKIWSLASGALESTLKITSYTEAKSRSRDYLIRSHAVLSEASTLIAVATRFGRSIEIWDWAKRKCLQTIANAHRWAASRVEVYDNAWSPLAVYHAETHTIDLFHATREKKKPFFKDRTIELKQAGLPFVPVYPEMALSATSPLLVLAAGPRPPVAGHPPPERETLLVAWETGDSVEQPNKPYRIARPWQHKELDTAIPCDLVAYGSVVVSIWIPASFRALPVPASRHGSGYNLAPVSVTHRYILVWDVTTNSTRTTAIPNCTSCISPDGRLVAYCNKPDSIGGPQGTIAVIDVITGAAVWSWSDRTSASLAGDLPKTPTAGLEQLEDLAKVNELAFSADGRFLIVGDSQGTMAVYDVRERGQAKDRQ